LSRERMQRALKRTLSAAKEGERGEPDEVRRTGEVEGAAESSTRFSREIFEKRLSPRPPAASPRAPPLPRYRGGEGTPIRLFRGVFVRLVNTTCSSSRAILSPKPILWRIACVPDDVACSAKEQQFGVRQLLRATVALRTEMMIHCDCAQSKKRSC